MKYREGQKSGPHQSLKWALHTISAYVVNGYQPYSIYTDGIGVYVDSPKVISDGVML